MPKADIRFEMRSDDLVALTEGRLHFAAAWASGRVKVHAGGSSCVSSPQGWDASRPTRRHPASSGRSTPSSSRVHRQASTTIVSGRTNVMLPSA